MPPCATGRCCFPLSPRGRGAGGEGAEKRIVPFVAGVPRPVWYVFSIPRQVWHGRLVRPWGMWLVLCHGRTSRPCQSPRRPIGTTAQSLNTYGTGAARASPSFIPEPGRGEWILNRPAGALRKHKKELGRPADHGLAPRGYSQSCLRHSEGNEATVTTGWGQPVAREKGLRQIRAQALRHARRWRLIGGARHVHVQGACWHTPLSPCGRGDGGEKASRRGDRRLPSPGFATLSRKGRGWTLNTYHAMPCPYALTTWRASGRGLLWRRCWWCRRGRRRVSEGHAGRDWCRCGRWP